MITSSEKDLSEEKIEELIQKIIHYKSSDGKLMLESFNVEFVNNYLSRNLTQIETIFNQYKTKKGIDIIDFLYQMLTHMEYNANQTLFVAVALIDFYQGIVENENLQQMIKFQNITNYICENDPTFAEGVVSDRKIPTKKLPEERKFEINRNSRVVREIDVNPPIQFKDDDNLLRRLTKEKNCIDAVHHNKNMIIASQHATSIQRVITLDSYSDHFLFYDSNCNVTQEIFPKLQQLKNQVCIDFCWSNKQQRLGASFRDGYLIFWEASDNFAFEKVFQINQQLSEEQTKIWYVECIDKWLTTDKKNQLYIWELEKEIVSHTLKSETFNKGILQVIEIPYLKVVAVATCDNQVAIWDFINLKQLFRIEVDHSHLNQIVFFKTYQVILTAGYDNIVNIYSLHSTYNDYNSLGKLSGHQTLVTSIQCIENTPMVITADDRFNIKVWDIRNMKCIQNMNIDLRNSIRFIHILSDRICLVSSRVTCLFFEDELSKSKVKEQSYPLAIEYDPNKKEMSICSRKDVKYLDIDTGRVKRIISGIISSQEDEITTFRVFQQNKKFFIGNQKGIINIFSSKDGENIGKIPGHNDEVSVIKMDYLNRLLTSASFDGNIFIQKELQNGTYEKLREISIGKEIQNLEISVYHNLMIATFANNELYMINYEFGKLLSILYLAPNEEPSCVEFISGYSIFIVGTSLGFIYFVQFKMHDDTIDLNTVAKITLNEQDNIFDIDELKYQYSMEEIPEFGINDKKKDEIKGQQLNKTKIISSPRKLEQSQPQQQQQSISSGPKQQLLQMLNTTTLSNQTSQTNNQRLLTNRTDISSQTIQNPINNQQQPLQITTKKEIATPSKLMFDIGSKYLVVAQHNGEIQEYDVSSLFLKATIQKIPHCNKKANYNAFRSSKEDFTKVIDKIIQFKFINDKITRDLQSNNDNQNYLQNTIFISSVMVEPQSSNTPHVASQNSNILTSPKTNALKGRKSNLRNIYQQQKVVVKDDMSSQDPFFNQTKNLVKSVSAHKDFIQCLQFIDLGKKYILSSSLDSYIKIWRYPELTLCCNLNTEHPLPILWNIEIDNSRQYKTKLLYALQSMKCVISKYSSQINHLQEKKFNFYNLFNEIKQQEQMSKILQQSEIRSSKTESSPQNLVLKKSRSSFQSYINEQIKSRSSKDAILIQPTIEDKKLENDNHDLDSSRPRELNKSKVRLMKEEFTVRDLIYDKIKDFYQEELKGPSLKHLNEMKKLYEAQQQQKKTNNTMYFAEDSSYKYKFERMEEKSKEFKHIITFLDEKYRAKVIEKPNAEFFDKLKYVEDLDEKMERSLQKKKRTQVVVLNENNSSKDSLQNRIYKRDNQKRVLSIHKKRQSPKREIRDISQNNGNTGDTFNQGKTSKSEFRITNSTSCNSFQHKNDSFYSYAHKRNLLDDQSTLNYSELNKNYLNTNSTIEQNILRKTETKYFSNIMKKMDEKLRKSKGLLGRSQIQNFTTISDQQSNDMIREQSYTNNFFNTSHKRNVSNNIRLDSLAKKNSCNSTNNTQIENNPTFQTSHYSTAFDNLYKRAESRVLKKY